MTMPFFSYPKFFLSGICRSASLSKAEFLFLKPLLTSLLQFCFSSDVVFVFFFFPSLHAFSPRLAYSQSRTQPITQQLIRPFSRTCDTPDSWPRPPGGEDGALSGRLVGGDEPGSSALSPAIHTQWVHSHTCLIAWPIGGGAH